MKRTGLIASLIILIVILSSVFSFAGSLELVSSYPEEGSHYSVVQNVVVKLEFNEKVAAESVQEANSKCFVMKSEDGTVIPTQALYDEEKWPNEIWLMVNENLESDKGYTVTISDELQSASGNTLEGDLDISFRSRNLKADSRINTILMVVMIVVMVGMTMVDTQRQVKKEMEKKGVVDKVDVYKEAKRTGKSVSEVVAQTEKKKQQVAKKYEANKAKYEAAKKAAEEKAKAEEVREGVKQVKARRPISAIGKEMPASIKAERAAKAEAVRKAEEARLAKEAEWKAAANKKKGSHQQQKKAKK